MTVFIYGLVCPLSKQIRYIGKSVNPQRRLRSHISAAARFAYNHHTARWLRKLIVESCLPELIILRTVSPDERWQDVEREEIAKALAAGAALTNSTAGGEGLDFIDPEADQAYREKLSAAMKALWNRPERREEARRRSLDAWADPEITERRIESLKAFYDVPEHRARASNIAHEINSRPEVISKKSALTTSDWRGEAGNRRRQALASDAVRAKMSASAKARWADPHKREAALCAARTPEKRQQLSESAKARATPAYREMMAEKTRLSWDARRAKAQAEA